VTVSFIMSFQWRTCDEVSSMISFKWRKRDEVSSMISFKWRKRDEVSFVISFKWRKRDSVLCQLVPWLKDEIMNFYNYIQTHYSRSQKHQK